MIREVQSVPIALPAGTSIRLSVPIDVATGDGHFPLEETEVHIAGKKLILVNGFAVEDPEVGELTAVNDAGRPEVIYKHNKQKENKIYFVSATKLYQTLSIVNIPIHDHSSITQGGPAFGAYYTEYKADEDNNG